MKPPMVELILVAFSTHSSKLRRPASEQRSFLYGIGRLADNLIVIECARVSRLGSQIVSLNLLNLSI